MDLALHAAPGAAHTAGIRNDFFRDARSFNHEEHSMKWEKPQAVDMRLGFEITMYIANR